jgi:hypothetical protein
MRNKPSRNRPPIGSCNVAAWAACAAIVASGPAIADGASGTIAYQGKSGPIVINVKNVYLVRGPDAVSGKPIRRLVFSTADVGGKIKACAAMACSDGDLREGMTRDLDAGPRLNYWFVANDQLVQYSGTATQDTLKFATDTPQRVAGKLTIDDSKAGGARASVEFDATLLKEFAKGR